MAGGVAFLGTGTMGAPMARNLLKAGFQVRVWNRTADKARVLASEGADLAETPADISRLNQLAGAHGLPGRRSAGLPVPARRPVAGEY